MYSTSNKSLLSCCFYSFIAKQKVINIFLWVSVKVASKCFKLKKYPIKTKNSYNLNNTLLVQDWDIYGYHIPLTAALNLTLLKVQ